MLGLALFVHQGNAILQANPASERFAYQEWTRKDGLPDDRVTAVLQTRNGYLWAATAAGLARFDGLDWRVFSRVHVRDMVPEEFRFMAEDAEGGLWVGFRHGLLRWNGHAFIPQVLRREDELIGPIGSSRSGGVWVIAEHELWLLRQEQRKAFRIPDEAEGNHPAAVDFLSLRETADGLWLGNSRGLLRFDPVAATFGSNEGNPSLPWQFVLGTEVDAGGHLWVLHGAGDPGKAWLSRLDSASWQTDQTWSVHNGSRALVLFRDRQGALWLPNGKGTLSQLQAGRRLEHRLPPAWAGCFVLAMAEDTDGGLWMGTENNGILRCRPLKVRALTRLDGLPNDRTWTLCEARDGSVWVGTDGGASRFQNGTVRHYSEDNGLSRNAVRSIVEDADGRIWIGTGSGLNWIEGDTLRQYQFPGDWFNTKIRVLLPGRNRVMWVGTAKGVYRLQLTSRGQANGPAGAGDGRTGPFEVTAVYGLTNGLPSEDVRSLLEDHAGNLWAGTFNGGLHRLVGGEFRPWATNAALSGFSVWALHEDAAGALWLGTERGLARVKDGRTKVFTVQEGLPDDAVNHILEDDRGQLWLGGERGIHRLNKHELDEVAEARKPSVTSITYDEDEGLASRETNGQKNQPGAMRAADGRLWFPTIKGAVILDPRQLPDQTNPPPVIIERIRARGETVFDNLPAEAGATTANSGTGSRGWPAELPAGSGRILEVHYTANTFVAAERLRFKYRLEGLESAWTDAGTRRVAQYANLKPGRYRFQVLAANKYGVWNETGATFAFTLLPFFWQTGWFKALCLLIPALAGYGSYRFRLAQHRRQAESERMAAVSAERAEIARDLHDHLGARLTLVQHLSEGLERSASADERDAPTRQRLVELVQELNASLDSAVWAVQPEKDTLLSLADYLGDSFQELLTGKSIELELDFPDPIPAWPLSRSERYHLALIALEALNNILKHSHATHTRLRLELGADSFTLVIADNGSGFQVQPAPTTARSRPRGDGLANMQRRTALLGGRLDLSSRPQLGTTIAITVAPAALRRAKARTGRAEGEQP